MGKRVHYTEEFVENFKSIGKKVKSKVDNSYNGITVLKHKEAHVWFMKCHCDTIFSGIYYNLKSGGILGCGCNTFDNMRATKCISLVDIISRLKEYRPSYNILESNKKLTDRWKMHCVACNTDFTATPEVMLDKRGRLSCKCSNKYRRTYKEWVEEVTISCSKKNLTFLSFMNNKPTKSGQFTYRCNTCFLTNTARVEHVLNGTGCPVCNGQNQKQNYLFEVWDGHTLVAYKMGIAIDYKRRLKEQQCHASKTIKVCSVYEMETADICRGIEKYLLETIPRRLLTKEEYPDGFSETVAIIYKYEIISKYKEHGNIIIGD